MPGQATPGPQIFWHSNQTVVPEWLVKNVLPRRGIGLMSGQWSSAKTFMALELAYCVYTGKQFAGHRIKRQGGTLFLAAEAAGDLQVRSRALALSRKTTGLLPFAWIADVPKLSDPKALSQIEAIAKQVDQDMKNKFNLPLALIIIDTMSAAAGFQDENSAAHVQPIMNTLGDLARRTDTHVLAIDHLGKSTDAGTRGST